MQHPDQPEGDQQEDAHADKGDDRVEQRRAYQAAAQVQALEERWEDKATHCREQQGKAKSQADCYRQER